MATIGTGQDDDEQTNEIGRIQLTDLIQFLPDATLAVDGKGRVIIWNRAIEIMTGIPASDMLGRGDYAYTVPFYGFKRPQLMDMILKDDPQALEAKYPKINREDDSYIVEVFCPALYDGRGAWVLAKASPLHNEKGEVIGAIESIRDITAHRVAEQKLRESEERFRELVELLPETVYEIDPDGRLTFANHRALEMFGFPSPDAIRGIQALDMLAPESRQRAHENMQKLLRGEQIGSHEHVAQKTDGSRFPVLISSSAIVHEGKTIGLRGLIIDITENRRAEAAVHASEEKCRALVEGTNDIFYYLDAEGRVQFIGHQVTRYGLQPADLVGRHFMDLVHPDDQASLVADYMKLLETEQAFISEFRILDPDGQVHWLEELGRVRRDENNNCIGTMGVLRDVTDRKRAERALLESEEKFSMAFETAPYAITITRAEDGKFVDVNAAFTTMTGYAREEAMTDSSIGLNLWVDDNDRQRVLSSLRAGRPVVDEEYRFRTKDGCIITGLFSAQAIELNHGYCVISSIGDITKRKQAEEALRTSQQITERILQAIPIRVFWKDRNLSYLGCNAAFAHDAGFEKPDDLIGKDDYAMGWCDQAELYRQDDRQVIESGVQKLFIEEPQTTPKGNRITLLTSKLPLYDAQGRVSGILGVYTDITDLKRTEAALRESENILRSFVASHTDMVYLKDAELRHLLANPALCRFFGRSEDEILGHTDHELLPQDVANRCKDNDLEALRTMATIIREEQVAGRFYETRKFPVALAGGKIGVGGIIRDITERREKAALEEQLHHTTKMEALGKMASGVAHDFNNILTAMQCIIDLMKEALDPGSQECNDLKDMGKLAAKAAALTGDLLAYSRKQALQTITADIPSILERHLTTVKRIAGENVAVDMDTPSEQLWGVSADCAQVEHVINNLVANASHAMPDGGTLTIEANNVRLATKLQSCPDSFAGDFVVVSVSDTGTGIPPHVLPRIFEPFFTTKPMGEGSGLGLARVYGSMRQHGGFVNVRSTVGQGTTFELYFPAVAPHGVAAPTNHDSVMVKVMGHETILLVDDDEAVRTSVARGLRRRGFKVVEAANAGYALLHVKKGRFDLIVTDVIMPVMDGRELVQTLASDHPEARVLYISGLMSEGKQLQPFFAKPFDAQALAEKIREILDSGPLIRP